MVMDEAIGPYRVVKQLGEGGQGVVYLATAPDGTRVAVKVLREGVPGDGRFEKEIAAARRVEPFCIAQVLDASLGARPYIVTEYVEGPSLHQAGRHSGADLQRLAVATATALAAVHRAGVVHRDFKPHNVLLGRDGPRVIDFGIARAMDAALTRTSSVVGTPAYMAPEQFLGAPAGPAVDVFAWGSVMVYAAIGAPPFGNDSLPAVLRRIQYEEPNLGEVPEPLRSIVYACLNKNPDARPAMQDVLFQLIGARPAPSAPPPGPMRPPAHPGQDRAIAALQTGPVRRRRNGVLMAGGAAAAVVVTGGVVAALAWSPLWPGRDTTAMIPASTPAASSQVKAPKETARALRPRPTKTRETPKASPSTTPTEAEPSTPTTKKPTSKPTTAKPTTAGGVKAVSFEYEGIRDGGSCWPYDTNIWANVTATGQYSYRWYLNGQSQGAMVGPGDRRPLLPSIVWKKGGPQNVVFEVFSPNKLRRSFTVTICDFDAGG
ncbi:Serine/threonine protein kinase [Nonomuraea solani]|uniref:non-specific serine/threonine protein kinase n=1 Tax=Nonomuraea solani TaxID=1144553 RepID=A0A1H6E8N8_9ACTN|nr:protein kinase [Nonomuraea solani]SEG93225.1 Serine/threonine protein kinase [Nonomuraea solani]